MSPECRSGISSASLDEHLPKKAQSKQFIQAFSGIFRGIQLYSAMLKHIEAN